jgi:hypothetical protein
VTRLELRDARMSRRLSPIAEERGNVTVVRASMPGAIGDITRLARKRRRARYAVPMLGNLTPRSAARTKSGREKLAVWLKHLENRSRQP